MLVLRLVQLSRIRKMHFVAMKREEGHADNERENQRNQQQSPIPAATNEQSENKINNSARDEARLKTESRQQKKSRHYGSNRRAGGVEQSRDANAVHPASDALL